MSHHEADHGKVPPKREPAATKQSQKPQQSAQEQGRGSSFTQAGTQGQTRTGAGESEPAEKPRH